jgi:hypothetical protein
MNRESIKSTGNIYRFIFHFLVKLRFVTRMLVLGHLGGTMAKSRFHHIYHNEEEETAIIVAKV